MKRKKPASDEYREFVSNWAESDHEGKLDLAKTYGVSYDTAKHWVLEGDTSPAELPPMDAVGRSVMDEVAAVKHKIALDFVSFDIETSGLDADWSIILSAVVKPYGQKPVVFRADSYPEWLSNRANDEPIVADVALELGRHAVIVTHYGTKFDIRYLRAKMMRYGLSPLPLMRGMDTYKIAKDNMAVSRRRLDVLSAYLFNGKKTQVSGNIWMDVAYNGSKERLDEIVAHNIQDCELLEQLAQIYYPYVKTLAVL